MEKIGVFNEETGIFDHLDFNLKALRKGWNQISIIYDNKKYIINIYFYYLIKIK